MVGFATLLEYISPTSASDQTIANIVADGNNLTMRHLHRLWITLAGRDKSCRWSQRFCEEVERTIFIQGGFGECLAVTILMYNEETDYEFSNHVELVTVQPLRVRASPLHLIPG